MAYAYSNLNESTTTLSRKGKGADQDADILREFKRKLSEDEGYIAYFNERIRIEQTYIESLTRLHTKTTSSDALHDDVSHRGPMSTARQAWTEVRDYSVREIACREAFVHALKEDVIGKLVNVRDTQTRIRTRIRDDLKFATDDYEDYAFSKVPKLKRSYQNRTQALVDFKKQEHAIAMQAKLLAEASPPNVQAEKPHPYEKTHHHSSSSSGSPIAISPSRTPSLTTISTERTAVAEAQPAPISPSPVPSLSFQPLSPPQRSGISNRARSGSGSINAMREAANDRSKEVLSDIAAQGKKGFSAIMQRFAGERDGLPVEVPTSAVEQPAPRLAARPSISRSSGALKGVKIKREADEADKLYRTGVFECESRRLRREKLHHSAVSSLSQFNDDLNVTLQISLRSFIDATHGTSATLSQSTDVIARALRSVNHAADTMLFRSRAPHPVQNTPILYDNYYVGPCRSLIFGVSLTDYDFARGEGGDHGRPPLIVEKCIATLDARGLRSEGIYRMSGRQATVKQMVQDIERNEEVFQFSPEEDIFSIAVVLKQYLRELPEPLFALPQAERVKYTENREQHISTNFAMIRGRLRRLPPIHQTTFQAILEHLTRVAQHLGDNKMDPKNLAVVFNSVLFGQDQLASTSNALTMHLEKDTLLEDLITYSDLVFRSPSPAISTVSTVSAEALPPRVDSRPAMQRVGSGHAKLTILPAGGNGQSTGSPRDIEEAYLKLEALEYDVPADLEPKFTPDEELNLLFDPSLIPASMRAAAGDDLHVRPLASDDFLRSHFGLLGTLSTSPPLAPSVYASLFNALRNCEDTYFICVFVDRATDQIMSSGTLIREKKFIHGAGLAGHIEDIVLSPNVQGRGLGRSLVEGLRELSVSLGCYKVILDCQESKVPFYEKCGFTLRGRQMAYYVPEPEPEATNLSPVRPDSIVKPEDAESVAETLETMDTTETDTTSTGVTYHFPTTNGSSGTATPGLRGVDLERTS